MRSARPAALGLVFAIGLGPTGSVAHAQAPTHIMVSVTSAACPELPAVEEALARRGLRATAGGARFRVQLSGAGDALDLTLRDEDGEVLLARTLAAAECGALADTVAMLVARRLAGIVWQGPVVAPPVRAAPPPASEPRRVVAPPARVTSAAIVPSRPWALEVQLGGVLATGFAELGMAPGPQLMLRLRPPQPYGLRLSASWLVHDGIQVSTGEARIDRLPIEISGGYSLRRRRFELDLGPCAELEVLVVETRDIAVPGRDTRAALRAGATLFAIFEVVPHLWLGVQAGALGVLSGWRFSVSHRSDPATRTRLASQALALELGAGIGYRFEPGGGHPSL